MKTSDELIAKIVTDIKEMEIKFDAIKRAAKDLGVSLKEFYRNPEDDDLLSYGRVYPKPYRALNHTDVLYILEEYDRQRVKWGCKPSENFKKDLNIPLVNKVFSELSAKKQYMLAHRLGLSREKKTHREIGEDLGITGGRVAQVVQKELFHRLKRAALN